MLLDTSRAGEIADSIVGLLEDEGYSAEEIIPGLIQGVLDIASNLGHQTEQALDEAANFLADGGLNE